MELLHAGKNSCYLISQHAVNIDAHDNVCGTPRPFSHSANSSVHGPDQFRPTEHNSGESLPGRVESHLFKDTRFHGRSEGFIEFPPQNILLIGKGGLFPMCKR